MSGVLSTLYPTALIPQLHIVVAESNRKASVDLIANLIAEKLKDDVRNSVSRPTMTAAGRQRSHTSVSSISSISRRTSIATSISQPFTSLLKATDGISLLFFSVSNIGVFADLKVKLLSLLDQSSEIYVDVSDTDLSSLVHHAEVRKPFMPWWYGADAGRSLRQHQKLLNLLCSRSQIAPYKRQYQEP